MMIFRLLPPGESQGLIPAGVSQPLGFARGLRFLGKQSSSDSQIDALSRKQDRSPRHPGFRGRQGNALLAGKGRNRHIHIEQQLEAPSVREQRRKVRSAFALRARHQRYLLAFKPSFADQQARRYRYTHPPVFQYVHGEAGPSCRQLAGNVKVVVNPRERGVQWRRFGIVLDWVRFRPQHAVFVDRNHDPSRDMGRFNGLFLGSSYGSPTERSGHKAGEKRSQSKLSELQKYGENYLFHGSSLTSTARGDAFRSLGDVSGEASIQSKNAGGAENCAQISVLVTGGDKCLGAFDEDSAVR